jgi:hypothetical protein
MHQLRQIKPTVKPVGKGAQVAIRVLGEVEVLASAVDLGAPVTQDGVDPGELRQVSGFALDHHNEAVGAAHVYDAGKASQAVTAQIAARAAVGYGPALDGFGGEGRNCRHFLADGSAFIIGRDSRDDGRLLGRATPGRFRPLATHVGIVHQPLALKRLMGFSLGYRMQQFVVQEPGGAVVDTELALEGEAGDAGRGLADDADRQKPGAQQQLGH